MRSSGRCKSASRANSLMYCSLLRVYVTHHGLNVIVSGDILQRKGIRILSGLGQKSMTQSVEAGIGMGLDLLPYFCTLLRGPGHFAQYAC